MSCSAGQSPIALGWYPVYQFTNFVDISTFTYDYDYSYNAPAFTRILYLFKANEFSVWCEFDDFTSGNAARVGLPTGWVYDVAVTNMKVYVNNPGSGFPQANQATISNRSTTTGKINFWPSNYGPGVDGIYNSNDDIYSTSDGYGSMQIFDTAPATPECIISWSGWGQSGGAGNLGMGNPTPVTSSNPDWTFVYNSNNFANKLCRIYVK